MGFWDRTHNLDRMTLPELVRAYFVYPAILAYLLLAVVAFGLMLRWAASPWPLVVAGALAVLVYPLVWYLLHRFVLHGRYLYRVKATSAMWKRIHFDHHQDPHNLNVLFGALYTTLPTVGIVTLPIGWLVGGPAGAMAAFAMGLVTTCFYEFCHCVQHLNFQPKSAFLQRIKRLHLAHHFHNEQGNYGITNFLWDRVFGSYYDRPRDVPKSATVFNLGYTEAEAARYPWVAALSGGTRGDDNPRRFRAAAAGGARNAGGSGSP
jgi:sterol desaturase/sphingolipid hydroxylase (fatty acid hydroxylase superfamily)